MVLEQHIRKIFFIKILIILFSAIFLTSFIEITHVFASCKKTCTSNIIIQSLINSIILTDDALFFVIIISSIWFVTHLIKTSQMVIMLTYTKSPFIIPKNMIITILQFTLVYSITFDILLHNFINGNQTQVTQHSNIPHIWIPNFPEDKIYHFQNTFAISGTIYTKDLTIFNIKSNTISTSNHKDISISKTHNPHQINFQKLTESLFTSNTNYRNSIVKNSAQAIQNKIFTKPLTLSLFYIFQKYLSLITASMLSLTFMLQAHTSRGNQVNISTLKCVIASILSFTTFEILKIINVHSITNQKISSAMLIAFTVFLFYRFIKENV